MNELGSGPATGWSPARCSAVRITRNMKTDTDTNLKPAGSDTPRESVLGGDQPPAAEGANKSAAEVWVCGHTRKCRWKGTEKELVYVPSTDRLSNILGVTKATCPRCGGDSFYVR